MLPWVSEIRCFGIYVKQSTNFKRSIGRTKRSFHRSTNAIFNRVGRITSEDITLQRSTAVDSGSGVAPSVVSIQSAAVM